MNRRRRHVSNKDFRIFSEGDDNNNNQKMTSELKTTTFKYLSSEVEYFDPSLISSQVLQSMLNFLTLEESCKM